MLIFQIKQDYSNMMSFTIGSSTNTTDAGNGYPLTNIDFNTNGFYNTGNSFDIGDVSSTSRLFDGYIHTPEGDFAIQGPIFNARQVLKDIEQYCRIAREKRSTDKAVDEAYRERERAGDRFRNYGEEEPVIKAIRNLGEANSKSTYLEVELKNLAEKVAVYR